MTKFILFSVLLAVFVGCTDGAKEGGGTTFLSASKSVLPVISGNARAMWGAPSAALRAIPTWMTWGDMADEAAYIFLDPSVHEADGTSLGVNNIYHLLNDFGSMPTSAASSFSAVVSVPWFEDHDVSSTAFFPKAFSKSYTELQNNQNYVAKSADTVHVMRAATGGGGNRASNVFQVIYDSATGEMQARFQGAWDYTANFSQAFVMRFEFYGKPSDHTFTLRATKWNSQSGAYYTQIVGKGISQGAGKYFLFKIKDNNIRDDRGNTLGSAKYFCFDASTTVASDVTATIATSSCSEYQSAVDAITGIIYTDMPTTDVFDTTVTTQ